MAGFCKRGKKLYGSFNTGNVWWTQYLPAAQVLSSTKKEEIELL
jgi:hypothetical protein